MRKRAWALKASLLTVALLLGAGLAYLVVDELRTSRRQASYLAHLSIRYPSTGPFDQRLGYAQLPAYLERLRARGYTVAAQDSRLQQEVTEELLKLRDPSHARAVGLMGYQLLQHGDPRGVTYSFTLFERTPGGNRVRVQADNFDQPFDINEGVKLDLGSTAKLRTLIAYLEVVAALHQQYAQLDPQALKQVQVARQDPIRRWAIDYLAQASDRSLSAMLAASLERKYSGNPGEWFFTGGGMQHFDNFEPSENYRLFTVREGLQHSVNLVYVRLMRDLVRYYSYQVPGSSAQLPAGDEDPRRQEYLQRFADREGRVFIAHFYRKLSWQECAGAGAGADPGHPPDPQAARGGIPLHRS